MDYVCPTMGILISSSLFAAPVNDLRRALGNEALGPLNPRPWAYMTGNTLGWCTYAYYTTDPFILASNLPGLILSLWLNMGATKLQYLAQVEARSQRRRRFRHGTDGSISQRRTREASSSSTSIPLQKERNSLIFSPQDVLFLRVMGVWAMVLVAVGWLGFLQGYEQRAVGVVVNLNLIFFYAAPLGTRWTVLKTKVSDTIHTPTMLLNCGNAAFWMLYGIARNDVIIYGPNGLGLALGLAQAFLCVWYPKTGGARDSRRIRGGETEFQPVWDVDPDADAEADGLDPDETPPPTL